MTNTADMTGGKPIVVSSVLDVSTVNPLVTFYLFKKRRRAFSFLLSRILALTPIVINLYKLLLDTFTFIMLI
jgi:hypothetical protein